MNEQFPHLDLDHLFEFGSNLLYQLGLYIPNQMEYETKLDWA